MDTYKIVRHYMNGERETLVERAGRFQQLNAAGKSITGKTFTMTPQHWKEGVNEEQGMHDVSGKWSGTPGSTMV